MPNHSARTRNDQPSAGRAPAGQSSRFRIISSQSRSKKFDRNESRFSELVKELVHRRDTTKTRFLGSQFYSYRIQLYHSGITYIMVSDFQKKIDIHNSNIFTIFLFGVDQLATSWRPAGSQLQLVANWLPTGRAASEYFGGRFR